MISQCSDIFKKTGHEEIVKGMTEKEDITEKHKEELDNVRI